MISINPNPWISSTTIEFDMPESGKGIWKFYDVNGILVYKIEDYYLQGNQE